MKKIENQVIDVTNTKNQGKKKIIKPKCSTLSKTELRRFVKHRLGNSKANKPRTKKHIKSRLLSSCINKQQLNCPICLEYLIYPTSLECGHSYCLPCIENFNKINSKNQCSLCRMDNQMKFHQIDQTVNKLVRFILRYKLDNQQKKDYLSRKDSLKKEYEQRGIKYNLGLNDQVKVKVKNHWVRGRVSMIHGKGSDLYYDIFTYVNQEMNHLSQRSINIKQQQFQRIKKAKRQSNCIFSENIFIEDHAPCRPVDNNTYNIEQLLWEVNYYEPSQQNNNYFWNFRTFSSQQNRDRQNQIIQLTSVDFE